MGVLTKVKSVVKSDKVSDKVTKLSVVNIAVMASVLSNTLVVGAEETPSALAPVTTGFSDVTSIMTSIWNFMIGNPLMCCFMAVSIAACCAGLLKKFKRVSR